MAAETDEQFVERVGLDFDLSNTADIQRLFDLARRGAEAGKLLAEQDHEYNRKTNDLIARHAEQLARRGAAFSEDPMRHPCVEALMNYQQADEDGVMVLVSRQAIHETVALLTPFSHPQQERRALAYGLTGARMLQKGYLAMSDPVDLTYMARIWRVFGVPKLGKVANDE